MPRALSLEPSERSGRYSMRERLALLIGDRRRLVVQLGGLSILSAIFEAAFLALISQIALAVVASKRDNPRNPHFNLIHINAPVQTLILVAFGFAVCRLLLQIPLSLLPARIAADVQARLRKELFAAFTRSSWGTQSAEREGHLQETMTGQVMQATSGAVQATSMITSLFTFLVLLIAALLLNPLAAGIVLGATLVLFAALRPLNALGARRARALSKAQLEYAQGVGQASRLAEETQVFGVGAAQRREVATLIDRARDLFFRTQVIGRLTPSIFQSAIYLILIGGLEVLYRAGASHVASLGAVILILIRAGTSGQSVQGSWQSLRQALPFIERLQDTRERYQASSPPRGGEALEQVREIAFEHVSFAYTAGRPVLSDVSFEVAGGESIGVVGPSGAGKSTLIQILLRLRGPSSGRYLVNGSSVDSYTEEAWHERVAYVPQEPRLLHASVAENIRYFRDFDAAEVERAAKLARIHDEIVSWPQGYETLVGPRADAVSGGQQQRICLARALVGKPEVLVLDEPTSALDPQSESLIGESLATLREQLTLFIVAHRLSTLDMCDRVMVIVDGRLVGFGEREELQSSNAYYRRATQLAFGGERADPWREPAVALGGPPRPAAGGEETGGNGSPASGAPEMAVAVRGSTAVALEPAQTALKAAPVSLTPSPAPLELASAPADAPRNGATGAGTALAGARLAGADASANGLRLPDFFIVGHGKSGTTAMYEMLSRHPQVFMPACKEPWFFAEELRHRMPPRPEGTPATLAEYGALFAPAGPGQIAGEATALYLWSHTAAERIAAVCPQAKMIAILREPAAFLRSLHLQFLQTYMETEPDFARALGLEQRRREGYESSPHAYWPQVLLYSEHVRYVEQLRRYERFFGPDQLLVLIYDDFRADNEGTMRRVMRFLEIDDGVAIEPVEANPTVSPRSQRLNELTHAVGVGRGPASRGIKRAIKAVTPDGARRRAFYGLKRRIVFAEPPPVDERLLAELRLAYRGEVLAAGEDLGRDLAKLWGYDELS